MCRFVRAGVVGLVVLSTACGGGEDPAEPIATGPSAPGFTFAESGVAAGQPIAPRYTCDGENVSPALAWEGVPEQSAGLALIMEDPDAPGGTFVHWLVYGLDPAQTGLPEGVPEGGSVAGPPASAAGGERLRHGRLRRAVPARWGDARVRLHAPRARRGDDPRAGCERRRAARGDGWAHPRRGVPRRAVLPPVALGVVPEGVHDLPAGLCPDEMEVLAVDVRVDDDSRDVAVDVDDADVDAPRLGVTLDCRSPPPSPRSSPGRSPGRAPRPRGDRLARSGWSARRMRSGSASNHPSK